MNPQSERLVLSGSRFKAAVMAGVCFLALLVGLWFIGVTDDGFMVAWSWIGVLLLGVGVIAALWQIRRPYGLELTPAGFRLNGMIGTAVIPWRDVEAFFVYESRDETDDGHGGGTPHAAWRLVETSVFRQSMLSKLSRLASEGLDGTVPRTIGGSPDEVVDLLESWRTRYR